MNGIVTTRSVIGLSEEERFKGGWPNCRQFQLAISSAATKPHCEHAVWACQVCRYSRSAPRNTPDHQQPTWGLNRRLFERYDNSMLCARFPENFALQARQMVRKTVLEQDPKAFDDCVLLIQNPKSLGFTFGPIDCGARRSCVGYSP